MSLKSRAEINVQIHSTLQNKTEYERREWFQQALINQEEHVLSWVHAALLAAHSVTFHDGSADKR